MRPRDAAGRQTWTSRFIREGDEEGIVELLTTAFGGWPAVEISVPPIEHLRWKLASDPYAMRYGSVAETDGGRIIATQLFFAQHVKVGESVLRLIQGVDLCVHPAFQGRGVMAELRAFAWPTFYKVFDMRVGQTQHTALRTLSKREGSLAIANEVEVLTHVPVGGAASTRHVDWAVCGLARFDERVDQFWREASKPFRFILSRSRDYLNWRYDPRGGNYTTKAAERDGRLLGYTVLGISNGKGHIADLLALPGRADVVASLVSAALAYFSDEQVSKIECWLPAHHPYREVMRELGFRQRKRTVHMTYGAFRASEEDVAFLSDPEAALHFVSGDLDLV